MNTATQDKLYQLHNESLNHLRLETEKMNRIVRAKRVQAQKAAVEQVRNSTIYQQLSSLMKSERFQVLAAYFATVTPELPTANGRKVSNFRGQLISAYLAVCTITFEEPNHSANTHEQLFPIQDIYQALERILIDRR